MLQEFLKRSGTIASHVALRMQALRMPVLAEACRQALSESKADNSCTMRLWGQGAAQSFGVEGPQGVAHACYHGETRRRQSLWPLGDSVPRTWPRSVCHGPEPPWVAMFLGVGAAALLAAAVDRIDRARALAIWQIRRGAFTPRPPPSTPLLATGGRRCAVAMTARGRESRAPTRQTERGSAACPRSFATWRLA